MSTKLAPRMALVFLATILMCFVSFSSATTLDSDNQNLIKESSIEAFEAEELSSIFNLFADVKAIYNEFQHIRHIVANHSRETIEIMDMFNVINGSSVCNSCQNFVGMMRKHEENNKRALALIEFTAETFCGLKLNKTVCLEAVTSFGPVLFKSLMDKLYNPIHFCEGIFLCPRTTHRESLKQFVEDILKDKPATNIPTPTKKATYNILQIADPHVDLQYQIGANAYCNEPLCCRAENGVPSNNDEAAQYWGTVSKCDIPLRTFEQFMQFASKNLKVDMIVWTGDNIAHDIWHQSVEHQTDNTYALTQEIMKYFPNTTVYPMFGNHESYPADEFDTTGNESNWLLERLTGMWKTWLDPESLESFSKFSYYSTVNPIYNVKIIALDTQACDSADFYLIREPTDPMHELEWLRKELYESEAKNQGVIIMGHIPPGHYSCDTRWAARYSAVVERFQNTIRGQLFGHTHNDHIEVIKSFNDDTAVGSVLIAPSFTTFESLHPSFRIIEVDAETHQPVNIHQYRLDLNKWNQNLTGPLEWDLAYSFVEEYGTGDMSFKALDELANKLKEDSDISEAYAFHFTSGAVPKAKLTKREAKHFYCEAKNSVSEDALKCLGLQAQVGDFLGLAAQFLPGAWDFAKC